MGVGFDSIFGKKCKTCNSRIKSGYGTAVIELDTAEGKHEIEVCKKCAEFWNDSAEVLQKQRFINNESI